MTSSGGYKAVFFDLDGTLVDTAPDMVDVLFNLQDLRQQPRLSYDIARNSVSNGAIGLLRLGFPDANDEQLDSLLVEYLDRYRNAICIKSEVFSPLREMLSIFSANDLPWGVVTNKPSRMTDPLLSQLGLDGDAICIVSGDTLAERKPHPAPLLHAAKIAGVAPVNTVYVGDAERDIKAGRDAGMATVAVGYGYITEDDNPNNWGADEYVADTMALMALLLKAVDLESQ
jgi:2-phosphoglycolate phosphatase